MTMTISASPGRTLEFARRFAAIVDDVERFIKGKREVIEAALVCLLAEGHLLLEDVPGVGKTSIARTLAGALGMSSGRIQFTPDLLPSDVTGVTVYNQHSQEFEFRPGPVFASVVVADEINRASPKTQSALLEVMEERQVTVDGRAHPVPRPFMVIATQNPVEMAGTYPLPEAQTDRFTMRISVGYPAHAAEMELLKISDDGQRHADVTPVVRGERGIAEMIAEARSVRVVDAVYDYLVRVISATRGVSGIGLGASPRAGIALLRTARVRAAAAGFDYVTPQDIKSLAVPVLAHRLRLTPGAHLGGHTAEQLVQDVLASTPVPDGS